MWGDDVRMMKFARLAVLLSCAAGWPASAQTWDNSGNNMLQGTYYFREVIYAVANQEAIALYGTASFNGSGSFTMNITVVDSNAGALQSGSITGTYSIAASGLGFLSMPLYGGYNVYGLVSQQGIFVGSDTEQGFNDLFIAAPLASPQPTTASFKGAYTIADFDIASPAGDASYMFQLNPDGAGNLGNVSVNGYVGGYGSNVYTQNFSNLKYSFSNGGCNLAFPNSNSATFISGQKFLYISPDGNFVFGGSPVSWDMFVGTRTPSSAPTFSGLFYEAGMDQNDVAGYVDSYYGSLKAGNGLVTDHQRTLNIFLENSAYGYTFSDTYTIKSDGTYNNGLTRYLVGPNGSVRIGSGIGPYLGLNVAVPAPNATPGSGVYLYPTGITNAASSAPFTSGIAPGELLTLYGVNLAPSLQVASSTPFPTTLNGVQVMISGLPAPIYYVSPTQVSVIVPYAVTGSISQVQIISGSASSNTVSTFVNKTVPGVFTQNQTGLGYAAIIHLDGSLVTPSHPAQIGETLSAFLTGLGAVNPLVPDGSAGPVSPLSQTTNTITVDVNGVAATVGYAGLAPQLAGLYQINFTVPTGLTNGDNSIDIGGPDSYTSEALISIGTATSNAAPALVPEFVPSPHRFARPQIARLTPQRLDRFTGPAFR